MDTIYCMGDEADDADDIVKSFTFVKGDGKNHTT